MNNFVPCQKMEFLSYGALRYFLILLIQIVDFVHGMFVLANNNVSH